MALQVILVVLVMLAALNALLVWDLYNRSARLALFTHQVGEINRSMAHSLNHITDTIRRHAGNSKE